MQRNDMTGQRYGRLTVKEFDHSDSNHRSYWLCQCDCGKYKVVRRDHLIKGEVVSCGCLRDEKATEMMARYWDKKRKRERRKGWIR